MKKRTSSTNKKRKSAKPKKSKQELEEERKQREADRARRDAERAKKRLTLRARIAEQKQNKDKKAPQTPTTKKETEKEQRKKILRQRRAQSRFALPKITSADAYEDIAKANAELEKMIAIDTGNKTEANGDKPDNNKQLSITVDDVDGDKEKKNDDEKKEEIDNTDTESIASIQTVEELTLSQEQEESLNKLQNELEAADPDYFGFVDYSTFMNILKSNDIKLSAKHETFLMGALTLIGIYINI